MKSKWVMCEHASGGIMTAGYFSEFDIVRMVKHLHWVVTLISKRECESILKELNSNGDYHHLKHNFYKRELFKIDLEEPTIDLDTYHLVIKL